MFAANTLNPADAREVCDDRRAFEERQLLASRKSPGMRAKRHGVEVAVYSLRARHPMERELLHNVQRGTFGGTKGEVRPKEPTAAILDRQCGNVAAFRGTTTDQVRRG